MTLCSAPDAKHLLDIADLVKIEIQSIPRPEQKLLVRSSKARGLQVLAEKVETHEEFEWARQAGYDYFQGYFFARPVMMRGRQIPAAKLHCLRLLQEAQRPELDFERLERTDPAGRLALLSIAALCELAVVRAEPATSGRFVRR